MPKVLNINWKEVLQQEYIVGRHGSPYIGKKYGCNALTVRTHLGLLGFKIRPVGESLKGYKHTEETKKKMSISKKGESPKWLIGRKLSEKTKKKMSDSHKGKKNTEEHNKNISRANKGRKPTKEQCRKISKSLKGRFAGENHWNWQDGKTPRDKLVRNSREYSDWRLRVFQKDKFACVGCGDNRGHNLQAHHILSFARNPKLRLDVSNGVTLCKKCHSKLHPDLSFIYIESA